MEKRILHPKGRLGLLMPNLGPVARSFITWIEALKKSQGAPANPEHSNGLNKTEKRMKEFSNMVPLARVNSFVFGGWEVQDDALAEASKGAKAIVKVQRSATIERLGIKTMSGVSVNDFLNFFKSPYTGKQATKFDFAKAVMYDMEHFSEESSCDRLLMFWCDAVKEETPFSEVHGTLKAFEDGLYDNHPQITPAMIYAYAAMKLGVPLINVSADAGFAVPALLELANETGTPVCGGIVTHSQSLLIPYGNSHVASDAKVKTAPAFLDLILFTDLAQRAGRSGMQDWLSFYFEGVSNSSASKAPYSILKKFLHLKNTLRSFRREDE